MLFIMPVAVEPAGLRASLARREHADSFGEYSLMKWRMNIHVVNTHGTGRGPKRSLSQFALVITALSAGYAVVVASLLYLHASLCFQLTVRPGHRLSGQQQCWFAVPR
jgi:hypothetical protein